MAAFRHFLYLQCMWPTNIGLPTNFIADSNLTLTAQFQSVERDTASDRKVQILIVFLFLAVLGGFALTAINVNHDFLQLTVFYKGFLGRKLLIQEGGLVRKRIEPMKRPTSLRYHPDANGSSTFVVALPLQKILKMVEAEREAIERIEEEERLLCYDHHHHNHYNQHHHHQQQQHQYQNHQLRSAYHPPANPSSRRLEEEDPEWRDLNYDLEVGTLPPCVGEFYLQYDWGCYSKEMTDIEIAHRKALLSQFRKWKARNMRKFKIVVTERGRREMAEAEEEKNKKRDKKAST